MQSISMNTVAFQAMLSLLNCPNVHILKQTYAADVGVDAFLAGRDALCEQGWASLDFDGKVIPSRDFARLTYDITCGAAAMRLHRENLTQWYLLAPTEMLFIEQQEDVFRLERRKGQTLMPWIRETLLAAEDGEVTTSRGEKNRQGKLSDTKAGSQERAKELVKHLALFFGKEEENA